MIRITKKRFFLFTFLFASLTAIGMFHHVLISTGLKWYLSAQLPKGESLQVSYERGHWRSGVFALKNVSLCRQSKEKKALLEMQVKDLRFNFSLKLFPFHFSSKLTLDSPEIYLAEAGIKPSKNQKGLYFHLDDIFFKREIAIEHAHLMLGSKPGTSAYFSFVSGQGEKDAGKLFLAKTDTELEKAPLIADFYKQNRDLVFDLQFSELDLAWLFSMSRFFSIPLDPAIDLSHGKLSGKFDLGWTRENQISQIQYDLRLHGLEMKHVRYGATFTAQQIHWKEHLTHSKDPFFEKTWPYFIGNGEFTSARINFEDQGCIELLGKLDFNSGNEPLADFHGLLVKNQHEYPLRLVAEGYVKSDQNWRLGVDLSLSNEEGEKMTTYLAVTSQGPKKYFIETKFDRLSEDPVNLIQHLFSMKYPGVEHFHVEKGVFNGTLIGWVDQKKLHRLEVNEFKAQNIQVVDENRKMAFFAQRLKGNGEFDLSTKDFFDGTFWEFGIEGGQFHSEKNYQVSDLVADISMHDQYVKLSTISGCLNGIEGEIRLEGLYTHLNANLDFELSTNELLELFGSAPKESKLFHAKQMLGLNVLLKTTRNQIETEGTLEIVRVKRPIDALSFTLCFDFDTFKNKGFFRSLTSGKFSAEHLSSETFNLPLDFFGKTWRGEGFISIDGTVDKDQFAFSIDPEEFRYVSPYITLEPKKGRGVNERCNFQYDFLAGVWKGTIPLQETKLFDHSFGLEFEPFNAKISLDDVLIQFHDVNAVSNELQFQGEISLDYQYENYAKLHIITNHILGETESTQRFLRHFKAFETMNLPLSGLINSGKKGMVLTAFVGDKDELLNWDVSMELNNGSYKATSALSFENLTTSLTWSWNDQILKLSNSQGDLCLHGGKDLKHFHLNIPFIEGDFKGDTWKYDLRLETLTHDICHLVGKADLIRDEQEFQVSMDSELTRFFGAKVHFGAFAFNTDGTLERLSFDTDLSARDLYHHLDFIIHAGLLPVKTTTLEEMQSPRFEGEAHLEVSFGRGAEVFSLSAVSDHFVFGTLDIDKLRIHAARKDNQFKLDLFEAGALSMHAEMIKQKEIWNIPSFDANWKDCHLQVRKGFFAYEKGKIHLPFEISNLDLEEFLKVIPTSIDYDLSYFVGHFSSKGTVDFDLSEGLKNWNLEAELGIEGESFSKAKLYVESSHTHKLSYSPKEGLEIQEADFHFLHPHSNQLWAKCHLNALHFQNDSKDWIGRGVKLIVPPEMLHHLGVTHAFPYLEAEEDSLVILDKSFMWDNQVELSFDFQLGKEVNIEGRLKEGYYWIGDKAWLLNDCLFNWHGRQIDLKLNTLLEKNPFDIEAEIGFMPHPKAKVRIQETIQELQSEGMPLTIVTDWSENEGFFIQSVEGALCGLDFSFHHNPRGSFLEQMVLTGQVKIDAPTLSRFLPKSFQEGVKEFEIGRGYEISGDCIISKNKLLESHFSGYLKGKRFQFMGSEMETLLSEISIHPELIELSHFNLSDAAGIFSMNEMRLEKMPDQKWNLTIPHVTVQDFRPSLLKKIGRYRGRIKPLTIRELSFHNIRGTLGNTKTFAGEGSLYFTNTFKRDYNILDIPFEILGRLGLDTGLLVPVRGRLDYIMTDGKVFLTELSGSFSEGKRSKFYLSPSQPSYIDFDGNLNLNVKMKQYVLLKITEPFTLSIGGTFSDPRYSLR